MDAIHPLFGRVLGRLTLRLIRNGPVWHGELYEEGWDGPIWTSRGEDTREAVEAATSGVADRYEVRVDEM